MTKQQNGAPAQGANAPKLTVEAIEDALDKDFKILNTLIILIRTTPSVRRAIAEELYALEERNAQKLQANG